jgi:hypothetical protein
VTGAGDAEADRAARERLSREARATATTLLDWVGTRVDGVATARTEATGAARPRQSAGPCTWCPVCALVAAVRGEQPELTAHLAEQASALLVVLRLLLQAHVHEHPGPGGGTAGETPGPGPADGEVPWDAPHAHFDPEPAPSTPRRPDAPPDEAPRPAAERPTGKRGPRPSPRWSPPAAATASSAPPPPTPTPAPAAAEARPTAGPARSSRGVQRIPVRRRPRPC